MLSFLISVKKNDTRGGEPADMTMPRVRNTRFGDKTMANVIGRIKTIQI
jgi:hypothetical protein